MAVIALETIVDAPRERVFDLARSVDVHQNSMASAGERAVGGVTSGLLGPNQEVTWQARHFGVVQPLSVKIVAFERPGYFQDIMVKGAFRSMTHHHFFAEVNGRTVMTDRFEFTAPLGLLGRFAERLFLTDYMRRLLTQRNAMLKRTAESDAWTKYLPDPPQR